MSLRQRSYEKELLDRDDIPFKDILLNMQELDTINTLLGGHALTCKGLAYFITEKQQTDKEIVIAEIGCGGGDNLLAINRFLQQRSVPHKLVGIDIKQECIRFAIQAAKMDAEWICSDYRQVLWPNGKPDIIFSSLFCHHFTDDELVLQLQWLKANSSTGFFINDLHRHPLAYRSIQLLTGMFSKSYLVKNDAPLSVKRGFKRKDWTALLNRAGIKKYALSWQWAFRFLLCVPYEQ